jgi:hypothetical protein
VGVDVDHGELVVEDFFLVIGIMEHHRGNRPGQVRAADGAEDPAILRTGIEV